MGENLESVISHGNRGHRRWHLRTERDSVIRCSDGFEMSVIAGGGTYCSPRPALCMCGLVPEDEHPAREHLFDWEVEHDYPGPFFKVEVGFPSDVPEPWDEWKTYCESPENPTETVYGYVPVNLVRALVEVHGGESPDPVVP